MRVTWKVCCPVCLYLQATALLQNSHCCIKGLQLLLIESTLASSLRRQGCKSCHWGPYIGKALSCCETVKETTFTPCRPARMLALAVSGLLTCTCT